MNKFLQNLSQLLRMIWILFPALLFVLLSLITFMGLSQGQDVLLMAVQRKSAAPLLIVGVTFFAFICWYTTRLIVYVNNETTNNPQSVPQNFWSDSFPRMLGYACFFATQAGIIAHPYFKSDHDTLLILGLLALQFLIYFIVYRYFKKHTDYKRFSTWLIIIALALVLLFSFIFSGTGRGTIRNNFMVQLLCLWVAQSAFLVWNFIRSLKIQRNRLFIRWDYVNVFGVKIIRLPATEIPFFRGFNIAIIFPALLYIAAIFSLPTARSLGAFNIAMLNFSMLTGFLLLVTLFSLWRKINLHFILFAIAIIGGFFYSPYSLRRTKTETQVYNTRIGLNEYAQQWIAARKTAILAADSYPVYFVLADGGASRSGYWVAGALGKMETQTEHKFSKHLFCLSGASGGSVGNAVFYSLLDTSLKNKDIYNGDYSLTARNYLSSDFLSATLSHMLGPDYFRHILNLGLTDDRGGALELSMENPEHCDTVGKLFAKRYSEYVKSLDPKQLPIFYINTTRVKDGSPGVVSNIRLDDWFTPRIDVLALMDSAGNGRKPFGDINLSSAAVLSARFPYLSPAANIDENYFVDGGYFDNSGAGIVMETIAAINQMLLADTSAEGKLICSKIQFRIVHLSNSEGTPTEPSRMHPLVNDLFTPVLTLAGSYGQQTNVNNDRLRRFVANYANANCKDCWTRINLYDRDLGTEKDTTAFSMNWVISDTTLRRMENRLVHNKTLNTLIQQISALKE